MAHSFSVAVEQASEWVQHWAARSWVHLPLFSCRLYGWASLRGSVLSLWGLVTGMPASSTPASEPLSSLSISACRVGRTVESWPSDFVLLHRVLAFLSPHNPLLPVFLSLWTQ